jgi:hypothetical protein
LIFPAAGAIVCLYVWLSLSNNAKIAGFAWLAIGALYLAAITRGFRTAPREWGILAEASGAESP